MNKSNISEDFYEEYETLFPSRWKRITQCRQDANLQGMYSLVDAKQKHLKDCSSCPICGKSVDQLSWIYYLDLEHGWPRQGGWMTVCDTDEKEVDFFVERQEFYLWEIVDAARNDKTLQAQFKSQSEIPRGHMHCPSCKRPPEQLSWFWFDSPKRDWESLAGRAGWMSVCDACPIQVEFLVETMS